MPNPVANPFVHQGAFDQSAVNDMLSCFEQQMSVNTTPTTLTNPTSATDLTTFTLPANVMNSAGKALVLSSFGVYNLGLASTLVFTVKIGGVTVATFTTASQATTAVTLAWNLQVTCVTVTPGSSGTMEVHGYLDFDSGATLAAAASTFLDSNTAALTALPYNTPMLVEIMVNLGSGNAGSTITSRLFQVELYN